MKTKVAIGILGTLVIGLTATLAYILIPHTKSTRVPSEVSDSVSFPLYYPEKLPKEFALSDDFSRHGQVVSSSYLYNSDKHLIMVQQARPSIVEDTKKTSDITTPLGRAFVSDLNGKTVGFIYADKTLIIISSDAGKIDDALLKKFVDSLSKS